MKKGKPPQRPRRFQRLEEILDILKCGDHLDTSVITERLANRLGADHDSPAFKRSVHRDLQELNKRDKINVDFYNRNDQLIEDYDPEVHANVICKWFIIEEAGKFEGIKILESRHVTLWIPEILHEGIRVFSGDTLPDHNNKSFYFLVSNQYIRIEIDEQILPFSFLVGRQTGDIEQSEKDFVKKTSKNCGILKIPYPEISSFRNLEKPGHALITFLKNKEEIQIQDFNSSNGTFLYPSPLNQEHVENIRESHNMTKTLKRMNKHPAQPEKLESTKTATLPALLELGVDLILIV